MNLFSNQYILLNGGIVILLAVSYLLMRRTPPRPVQLDLKPGERDVRDAAKSGGVPGGALNKAALDSKARAALAARQKFMEEDTQPGDAGMKSLNIIFNYNGHSWDAFEALGLPAGSSAQSARLAFDKMAKTVHPDTQEFLRTALNAILSQQS